PLFISHHPTTTAPSTLSLHDALPISRLQAALVSAAKAVPTGKARPLARGGDHVLYGDVVSTLPLAKAKNYTDDLLKKLPQSAGVDRKSTRLNSSHLGISYAVFCLKKK